MADEIRLYIIEPRNMHAYTADAGEEARSGPRIGCVRQQGAMHGHCLGGELDARGDSEAAVRPERVIRCSVPSGAAANFARVPADHCIEQTHAALMRNVRQDPVAVQVHGSTCTPTFDTSK